MKSYLNLENSLNPSVITPLPTTKNLKQTFSRIEICSIQYFWIAKFIRASPGFSIMPPIFIIWTLNFQKTDYRPSAEVKESANPEGLVGILDCVLSMLLIDSSTLESSKACHFFSACGKVMSRSIP